MKMTIANVLELEKHHTISISFANKFKLLVANSFLGHFLLDKYWKRK